ncbi:MAG: dihydrodipicolinate synthase family protein [Armatimonadia bacterium]|nr:dihydrodipicolinate synthase family protein [Armatimonadia bacterium]
MSEHRLPGGVYPTMITPFDAMGGIDWQGVDRLVDWYLERGVAGIFSVCGSSELESLTPDERLDLCERTASRAAPVPVVASGTFGGGLERQAQDCCRMVELGARAAIVLTGSLAIREEPDATWRGRLEDLMDLTDDIPLGFYEKPGPNKRCIPPDVFGELAATGRFLFHKDTTCDVDLIAAKIDAAEGSDLRFFNANASSVLASLRAGGAGFSGIAANFYPDVLAWLCSNPGHDRTEEVQDWISAMEPAIGRCYPLSAKVLLGDQGLGIRPVCRTDKGTLSASDLRSLRAVARLAHHLRDDLELIG